jgi:hypothetical protein
MDKQGFKEEALFVQASKIRCMIFMLTIINGILIYADLLIIIPNIKEPEPS